MTTRQYIKKLQRMLKYLDKHIMQNKTLNLHVYLKYKRLLAVMDCQTEQCVDSSKTKTGEPPVEIYSTARKASFFYWKRQQNLVLVEMLEAEKFTQNDWCNCMCTKQLLIVFDNSINIEFDCSCLNSTFKWLNPKPVQHSMTGQLTSPCLHQHQRHITNSRTSENCFCFLSVEFNVRLLVFLKLRTFDMKSCCVEDGQDVSIVLLILEQNMSLIFCENDARIHLFGIIVNHPEHGFPDNVILVQFQQSVKGQPCGKRQPNSKRFLLDEIVQEKIDPVMNVPDVDIQAMCKSAIRISLSQSRMGLSNIWIPDFINSNRHWSLDVNDIEYPQYVKTRTHDDKGQNSDDVDKDALSCSNKLFNVREITDKVTDREGDTYAFIPDTLTNNTYSKSEQSDAPAIANCDTRTKLCAHTVQANTHESTYFDHSLAEQRTTEIPSFDSNETTHRSMVSLSKPQKPHSDQPDDHNDHIQILRELTWLPHDELPVPEIDITVANVLDPIFRDMSSGTTPGPRVTMKYELLRLCTLRNYPKTNKPYIIRLAGAGFYYAADGDEVICYCCGIRRRNWTEECKPITIHRRLSPNCSFLTKNAEVNIPVPPASTEEMTRFALLKELIKDEESSDSALGNDSSMYTRQAGSQQQRQSGIAHQPTTTSQGQNQNSPVRSVPQQPKHPHYGVLNTRVGSFQGFPDGNGQDPAVLADAGFYYVGFEDCVRCFQCGVGLRHWAAEDDPWIEHCRWTLATPCPYLVKKKGEEFVSLVRMAIEITQNTTQQKTYTHLSCKRLLTEPNSQSLQEDTASHEENSVQATESSAYNNAERDDTTPSVDRLGNERPGSRAGDQRPDRNNNADRREPARNVDRAGDKRVGSRPSDRNNYADKREPMPIADRAGDKKPGNTTGTKSNSQSLAANPSSNARKSQSDIKKDTSKTSPTKVVKGKESLSDEQRRLIAENARLRDQTICRVCCQRGVCIVFLPCGHLVTCEICAPSVRTCPICSSKVKGTVKTFMS